MKHKLTMFAVALSLLIAGCSRTHKNPVLGQWKDQDGNITEFFEDGTLAIKHPADQSFGPGGMPGQWIILSDGRLKLDFSVRGVPLTRTLTTRFSGSDSMELQGDDGGISSLTRL